MGGQHQALLGNPEPLLAYTSNKLIMLATHKHLLSNTKWPNNRGWGCPTVEVPIRNFGPSSRGLILFTKGLVLPTKAKVLLYRGLGNVPGTQKALVVPTRGCPKQACGACH